MSSAKPNEVKTSILQRAMEMFQRYGLQAMTMDDVCRELSMSKKTLYQYFSNKADLVDQAVR
jgi:AcrR family transcriptional regulator